MLDECLEDDYCKRAFERMVNKERRDRMHYCFQGLPSSDSNFFEDTFSVSNTYKVQKLIYLNNAKQESAIYENKNSEEEEIAEEKDEINAIYTKVLKKRKIFKTDIVIDAMCKKYLAGDTAGALKLQLDLLPLINNLFTEVNPIPVKAAMSAMGYGENSLRLPLTPMDEAKEAVLLGIMKGHGLI
jgi:4-hydroxy-tetrahydrodipicolinate synthase